MAPDDALAIVLGHVRPLRPRVETLDRAAGRCLAQDVRADRDMPPADRSAMDGYAVRAGDLGELPCALRLAGEVAAGSAARPRVRAGTCVRILTGASVPPGADTVVRVENTAEEGLVVRFLAVERRGANIRRRGEEARKGAVLVPRGTALGAVQVGLCAAAGQGRVAVVPFPRIAVLCTGGELRRPGQRIRSHEIRDSNGPALVAALQGRGFCEVTHRLVPDDPGATALALKQALKASPLVIVTGGVSVGRYDFVPEALRRIGATVRFHGVNMRPGRPQLYATLPDNRHVFGLPGNPLSLLTGFHEFVLPAIRRLSGVAAEACRPALRFRLAGERLDGARHVRCVLARLDWGEAGPTATPVAFLGSADLAAANRADGVVIVPAGSSGIATGDCVEFRPWRALP